MPKLNPALRRTVCAFGVALLCVISLGTARADSIADDDKTAETADSSSDERFERGRRVFHRKCIKCHGSGREGAPVVGRPGEWATRLEQPIDVLVAHAIDGHQGPTARMPAKGGFPTLSDDDVSAAVHYIARRGRWLAQRIEDQRVACVKDQRTQQCQPVEADDRSLIKFLWLLQETADAR